MLLDTHCHLTHDRYDEDVCEVLVRSGESGVDGVVAIASSLTDAEDVRRLLERSESSSCERPLLWGTAGVHPHHARHVERTFARRLDEALSAHPRIVAVGECGLDFHYDFSPREVQRRVFQAQIELAQDRSLPVVVHCRDAEAEMKSFVEEAGEAGVRGVLHCFPGDLDLLDVALDAGWFVSFTGIVTFSSFEGEESVRRVPAGRYMLETDGPYLAPVPYRGKRNEPAFVTVVRDRVAELRGESPDVVTNDSTRAARNFFGLKGVQAP